jgi:adenylate kinase family enzyme
MDGNYGGTMPLRLASADTVVFLDLPTVLCVWRVVRRRLSSRRRPRADLPLGDRLTWEFLRWILSYRRTRRPRILAALEGIRPRASVFVLSSRRDVRRFLQAASSTPNAGSSA